MAFTSANVAYIDSFLDRVAKCVVIDAIQQMKTEEAQGTIVTQEDLDEVNRLGAESGVKSYALPVTMESWTSNVAVMTQLYNNWPPDMKAGQPPPKPRVPVSQ